MACAEFKIDYFSEFDRIFAFAHKLVVFDAVVNELNRLVIDGAFKKKQAAKLALAVIDKKNVSVVKTEKAGSVDDLFVNFEGKNYVVATIDAELKRRLKAKCVAVAIIRQKRYLELVGC